MRRQRNFIGPAGMGGMVGLWGASSLVKSVQYATCTIGGNTATGTVTITAVNTANSILLWGGWYSSSPSDGGTDPGTLMCRVILTSSTVVTAERTTVDATYGRYLPICVIEFQPGVLKSAQHGLVGLTGVLSAVTTITSVNTAKAALICLGNTTSYPSPSNNIYAVGVTLTNATTVTGTTASSASNYYVNFVVMEFF